MSANFPGATESMFGGMTPGDALGGGLAQQDPATNLPRGSFLSRQNQAYNMYFDQMFKPGMNSDLIRDQFYAMTPEQQLSYATPGNQYEGVGIATTASPSAPAPAPQPGNPGMISPNGNVTRDIQLRPGSTPYQPPPGNPQQIQNIAQGQPTLVNQLAPPPPQGPAPGTSITQVPPPAPQPRPQTSLPPAPAQGLTPAPTMQSLLQGMHGQVRPGPQYQAPQQAMNTRFPALAQNTAFARPPVRTVLNPRTPTPPQSNINSLAQVLDIVGRNPTFAPGAAGQFNLGQLRNTAPLTMRPQPLAADIRLPVPGQVLRKPTAVPYRLPTPKPTVNKPRR